MPFGSANIVAWRRAPACTAVFRQIGGKSLALTQSAFTAASFTLAMRPLNDGVSTGTGNC